MDLSSTFNLTIPSIHDGTKLECRLHIPQTNHLQHSQPSTTCGAVVAHPYAPLGGSQEDHVVFITVQELLNQRFPTVTFNFRGAGNSGGRTSWTGTPEGNDYISAVYLLAAYLQCMVGSDASEAGAEAQRIHVVLGGYSYGSMKAMHASLPQDFFNTDSWTQPNPAIDAIQKAASQLAGKVNGHVGQCSLQQRFLRGNSKDLQGGVPSQCGSRSNLTIYSHYLLISPLLPPISSLLGLSNPFRTSAREGMILENHPVLAIYGGTDGFTSAKKVTEWCRQISHRSSSTFQYVEVPDADHFWRSDSAQRNLRDAIRNWAAEHSRCDSG